MEAGKKYPKPPRCNEFKAGRPIIIFPITALAVRSAEMLRSAGTKERPAGEFLYAKENKSHNGL
jgi:hypothetical protein